MVDKMNSKLEDGYTIPKGILLVSGKRKSGKDFITDILSERIGKENSMIVRISAPIKSHWAKSCGLDLSELLSSSKYKESHRKDMIKWGEIMRERDYGYFCKAALHMFKAQEEQLWIISDTRRRTDLKWFADNYPNNIIKTVRIKADDNIRKQRGWVFAPGVDDAASECDLDGKTDWDWELTNNGIPEELENDIKPILTWMNNCLSLC